MGLSRTSPVDLSDDPDFTSVGCPHCATSPCKVLSIFGGAASEVLFQCPSCKTCFNWVKWQGKLPFEPEPDAS